MRRGSPGAARAGPARATLRVRATTENFMAGYLKPLGLPRQPETTRTAGLAYSCRARRASVGVAPWQTIARRDRLCSGWPSHVVAGRTSARFGRSGCRARGITEGVVHRSAHLTREA